MKRIYTIFLLTLLATAVASAQKGLNVDRFFSEDYSGQKNATKVEVRGKQLQPYHLKVFRSITLRHDEATFREMERCVTADGQHTVDRETGYIAGRLFYGFYCLPPVKGTNRYLFFRNTSLRKDGQPEATIVYMEGNATLEELKKMFK